VAPGKWAWGPAHLARAWHERLLALYGGAPGVRNIALLAGALDRPRNRLAYQPASTLEDLAAVYGFGIAKAASHLSDDVLAAWLSAICRDM